MQSFCRESLFRLTARKFLFLFLDLYPSQKRTQCGLKLPYFLLQLWKWKRRQRVSASFDWKLSFQFFFGQGCYSITLFAKFASHMDKDSVKESSTILAVSDIVSSQKITPQVKLVWQPFVMQSKWSQQLFVKGCKLLWKDLLAALFLTQTHISSNSNSSDY